jgi:uncharacterized protein YaiL (DUF2058 family)
MKKVQELREERNRELFNLIERGKQEQLELDEEINHQQEQQYLQDTLNDNTISISNNINTFKYINSNDDSYLNLISNI